MSRSRPRTEVVVYGFDPPGASRDHVVEALQRTERGGALRVCEVLFVRRVTGAPELSALAIDEPSDLADAQPIWVPLRPDDDDEDNGPVDEQRRGVRALGRILEPGAAVLAVRLEHAWAVALGEAIDRSGGRELHDRIEDGNSPSLARQALAIARAERALRPI